MFRMNRAEKKKKREGGTEGWIEEGKAKECDKRVKERDRLDNPPFGRWSWPWIPQKLKGVYKSIAGYEGPCGLRAGKGKERKGGTVEV